MDEKTVAGEKTEEARFADKLARLYRGYGLEQALSYILSSEERADHIQCVIRKHDSMTRVVLAESGRSPENYRHINVFRNLAFEEDRLLENVVDSDISYADGWHTPLDPLNTVHSFMRVRLFSRGDDVFFLLFFAECSDRFSALDMERWSRLAVPLGRAMAEDAERGRLLPSPLAPEGGVALLRLCRGLSGVMERVNRAAAADCTVLISGETGTGKSMLARALHQLSPRRRTFVHVDCGALSPHLVESELFGHERGAFSGAVGQRTGYLESADEGTLFLDEIGEMPLAAQTRLLRFLDRHEIVRVGSTRPIPLNVRVVAATNRNLRAMVREGKFREDLLYRLRIYTVPIPPLRERREDIVTLAQHFLEETGTRMGVKEPLLPGAEEMKRLLAYDWPGNVRELEHTVVSALVNACGPDGGVRPLRFELEDEAEQTHAAQGRRAMPLSTWPSLEQVDADYIREVLEAVQGKVYGKGGAAEVLKMHPITLRNRMTRLGIPMERGGR